MTFGQQWTGNGYEKARALNCQILNSFDYIAARDSASQQRLANLGIASELGYDPAFLLPGSDAVRQKNRVTVFVRGGPHAEHYLHLARPVLDWLHRTGAAVFLGACAAVDETVFPIMQRWVPDAQTRGTSFDWRRALDLVKSSSLVISFGRLHAVILATHMGTPSLSVDLPCHHPPARISGFCQDAGLPCVPFGGESLMEKLADCWEKRTGLAATVQRQAHEIQKTVQGVMENVWKITVRPH